jgi:hypothetical protein
MAKRITFPIKIKAGSTVITIYRDPLKLPRIAYAVATADRKGTHKSYDSYVVTYYQGGKRLRTRCNSLQEARDKAQAAKSKVLKNDSAALNLNGQDSLIYVRAKNLTAYLGFPSTPKGRSHL